MRIERVLIKNYRQFKDIDFIFKKTLNTDMHVVIGKNGTGKTNILNAINWCLYGDEPHLSKDSQQLPLLNLKSVEHVENRDNIEVMVEVWVKTEADKYIIFTRKEIYSVYIDEKQRPTRHNIEFEIKITDEKGNTDILQNEEAISVVERFVPKRIREFFFFDGERLDTYFKEATGQNIRHAIFEISQIDLLENRVESRLSDTLKDLRKEAGKQSPAIERTRNELEKAESDDISIKNQIDESNIQSAIAKEKILEYEDNLRGAPDIETLETEREYIKTTVKQKTKLRNEKMKEKGKFLFDYGKVLMLWKPIKNSILIIEEKRKNGELPPTDDKSLLESIIKKNNCSICGRNLDDDARNQVGNLLKRIKLSSETAKQLENMEDPLNLLEDKIKIFSSSLYKLTNQINDYENDLTNFELRQNQIDQEITGFDSEKIKNWIKELRQFEDVYSQNQRKLGVLEEKRTQILVNIGNLKKQLDEELKKEDKVKKLKKQIDFCSKSLNVVKETKEIIMNETRTKIESRTKELFFEILWKKTSFKNVKIENDYSINLIHSMDYECLGSVSAGERELLALSFTLALHEVSGFDSPILIDTPVARISDEHRANFGKIFAGVSNNKQTILLFTPAEYSEDISELLDKKASTRYVLKISSDEKETTLEVL